MAKQRSWANPCSSQTAPMCGICLHCPKAGEIKEIPFSDRFDFMLCSDGFGDEIIIDKVDALFDYFIEKYSKISADKRDKLLKQELVSSMQDKNNDDKSIVFGWICQ